MECVLRISSVIADVDDSIVFGGARRRSKTAAAAAASVVVVTEAPIALQLREASLHLVQQLRRVPHGQRYSVWRHLHLPLEQTHRDFVALALDIPKLYRNFIRVLLYMCYI